MTRRRAAGLLGVVGAGAGALAGVVQATIGSRIPTWSGAKSSPVELGALTIVLCIALLIPASRLLSLTPLSEVRRAAVATALVVMAGIGSTTVGLLWIVPGLLLLASATILVTLDARAFITTMARQRVSALVGVLGSLEVLMALTTTPRWIAVIGILGGLCVIAAPWLPDHGRGRILLLGAVPFAVLTWWSLAPPLVAALAVGLGWRARRVTAMQVPNAATSS